MSRGSASVIMYTYAWLLLSMCKNIITALRETVLHRFIPFDYMHSFHKFVACVSLVFTGTHYLCPISVVCNDHLVHIIVLGKYTFLKLFINFISLNSFEINLSLDFHFWWHYDAWQTNGVTFYITNVNLPYYRCALLNLDVRVPRCFIVCATQCFCTVYMSWFVRRCIFAFV